MDLLRAAAFAARFAAGFAAVLCFTGVLWAFLPASLSSPRSCLASGALAAGMFAFVRGRQPVQALALGAAAVSFHMAALWHQGALRALTATAANLVETGGIATAALVFHLLAERGVRFGKFLLSGPMVAIAFAAAGPASMLGAPTGDAPLRPLLEGGLIGLIVGDAVGVGLETGELGAALVRGRTKGEGA